MKESELPEIDSSFIEEKNLCNPVQKKLSAPFNKKERFERRQEVYRLHFEFGMPAVRISEIMGFNRNTINADINFWWSRLEKEWDYHSVESLVMRQLKRLDSQRARLMICLQKENDTDANLSIERLILDIDNRISQIFINTKHSTEQMMEMSVKLLNKWAHNLKWGALPLRNTDLTFVAEEDYEEISERIKESSSKPRSKGIPLV